MSKHRHAIETKYRNFLFRSRLEAKWAAFFDLCGWPWSYEPADFNGWIPDFAIGDRPTLVELKPFYRIDEWDETVEKIRRSGCTEDVLLLGSDPVMTSQFYPDDFDTYGSPVVGFLSEPGMAAGEFLTWEIHFGYTNWGKGARLGLCPMSGGWINKVWKFSDLGDHPKAQRAHRVGLAPIQLETALVQKWAEACNLSRWMPIEREKAS